MVWSVKMVRVLSRMAGFAGLCVLSIVAHAAAMAATSPIRLSLSGEPASMQINQAYTMQVVITNINPATIELTQATLSVPKGFVVSSTTCSAGIVLANGQTCIYKGSFTPVNTGTNTWSVSAIINDVGPYIDSATAQVSSGPVAKLTPSLSGIGLTIPQSSAAKTMAFVLTNTSKTESITVTKSGAYSFPKNFTVDTNDDTCFGKQNSATIAAQSSCSIGGSFIPSTLGKNTWLMHAQITGQPVQAYEQSVTVEPVSGHITVDSANSSQFIVANTGTVKTGSIALTNDSDADVNGIDASISGVPGLSISTSACQMPLKPDATCSAVLTYAPTATVSTDPLMQTATLSIGGQTDVHYSLKAIQYASNHLLPLNYATKPSANIASNVINKVYQDAKGVLYIATGGGLNISHDGGKTFTQATMVNGLGSNNINDVAVDPNGVIYVATDNGLSKSTDGGLTFSNDEQTGDKHLASWDVHAVLIDQDPQAKQQILYVGTENGLSISTDGGATYSTKQQGGIPNTLGSNQVLSLASDKNHQIYVGTSAGVSKAYKSLLNNDQDDFINVLSGAQGNQMTFSPDYKIVYAATDKGLYYSSDQGSHWSLDTTKQGLPSDQVNGVYVGQDGSVYVATQDGYAYRAPSVDTFTAGAKLPNHGFSAMNSIWNDEKNHMLYLGTAGGGLGVASNTVEVSFITTTGIAGNLVHALVVDGQSIYVGTNSGLSISADGGQTFVTKTIDDGLGSNQVNALFVDGANIYAGTSLGIYKSQDGGKRFTNLGANTDALKATNISSISSLGDGQHLSIATNNGLFLTADGGASFHQFTTDNGLGSNQVNGSAIDGDRSLVIATGNGISYFKNDIENLSNITDRQLGSNNVLNVAYGPSNKLYAATTNGISSIGVPDITNADASFTTVVGNGLPSNNITNIQSMGDLLYVSTPEGLATSTDGSSFTQDDFIGINHLQTTSVASANGMLYVATNNGVFVSPNADQ
jgi:ligand-binding sensor domain-containing protein